MDDICRLCLGKKPSQNIFNDNSTIHEKLLSYCKLNITKDDGLPDQVCNACVKKLENVIEFINRCEESDRLLRNKYLLGKCDSDSLTVKVEPYSDLESDSITFKSDDDYVPSLTPELLDPSKLTIKKEDIDSKEDVFLNLTNEKKPLISHSIENNPETKIKRIKKQKLKNSLKKLSKKTVTPSNDENKSSDDLLTLTKLEDEIKCELNLLPVELYDENSYEDNLDKPLQNKKKNKTKGAVNLGKKEKKNRSTKYNDESQLCFTCGKCFPRSNYLRQHILKHSGVTHKCSQCPKTFATKELMRVHERRHVQVKSFPCQVCGHTFTSGYLAKKHFKMVHEKNYAVPCKLCDRVLSNPRSLSEHMKIHTGEKNFECEFCHKKFAHKLSLVCHTRVHTGEQPYVCQFCNKRFSILKSLKEHERLHTGEKPYGCPLCPKRFEQLGNMKSHFRYNHKGLDLKKVQESKAAAQA